MFYDYLAYSKPNYLKNKRDQNQKNAYVVYVEKKTENIEKKPIKEQKENIKETKENFGHQTKLKYLKKSTNYEKRYYKSKKNQNKNTEQLFYYEPKVLINGKVLSEEKDVNIKENVDMKNNAQTPSEKTMKTENFKCEEAGKIELLPIINNLKKDIFNELEEKMDVKSINKF